jgi:multiple antibiotic resistance protein
MSNLSVISLVVDVAAAEQALPGEIRPGPFSLGKLITFLLLTLGPSKVIAPLAAMTEGRDARYKLDLAFRATLYAAIGLLAAASTGANTLRSWVVSTGALQLTAGIVLFLVALRRVMEQYAPRDARAEAARRPPVEPASNRAVLALAFPTIVTPYGVAVLVLVLAVRGDQTSILLQIVAVTAAVLALDFIAMLGADRIMRTPAVGTVVAIVGMVLAILQVALGVQAAVDALAVLGLTGATTG